MPVHPVGEIISLVTDIRNRKPGAFAALYDAYSGALHGAIARTMKNEFDNEVVLQNTFIKIWQHIDSYDAEKGSVFTWMLKIAQHEASDALRSKHHRQSLETGLLNDIQIAQRKNPFIHLNRVDLHKLLSVLKPKDRAIFELIYFRGYTCEQTAQILLMPCGTIKTKLQSGYRKLRTALIQAETATQK